MWKILEKVRGVRGHRQKMRKNKVKLGKTAKTMLNIKEKAEILAQENFQKRGNQLKRGTLTLLKSVPQRGCWFSNAHTFYRIFRFDLSQRELTFYLEVPDELSTWNSHSPCERCFLNLPQGVCGIQMELPRASWSVSKATKKKKKKPVLQARPTQIFRFGSCFCFFVIFQKSCKINRFLTKI